jgi:hypothetical protein
MRQYKREVLCTKCGETFYSDNQGETKCYLCTMTPEVDHTKVYDDTIDLHHTRPLSGPPDAQRPQNNDYRAGSVFKTHRKCLGCGDDFVIEGPKQMRCNACRVGHTATYKKNINVKSRKRAKLKEVGRIPIPVTQWAPLGITTCKRQDDPAADLDGMWLLIAEGSNYNERNYKIFRNIIDGRACINLSDPEERFMSEALAPIGDGQALMQPVQSGRLESIPIH